MYFIPFLLLFSTISIEFGNCQNFTLFSQIDPGKLIVGGVNAQPGECLYQATLFLERSNGYGFFCGGCIIGSKYILTAAHCMKVIPGQNPRKLKVMVGKRTLDGLQLNDLRSCNWIKIHQYYDPDTMGNDIALIKLNDEIIYDSYTNSIPLSQERMNLDGKKGTVSGFGATQEGGNISTALKIATVPILSNSDCKSMYSDAAITNGMVCAGLKEGGVDTCQGDSGGPMVCNGVLAGLTSWGTGCAQPNHPGVYTRVSIYLDWIKANM